MKLSELGNVDELGGCKIIHGSYIVQLNSENFEELKNKEVVEMYTVRNSCRDFRKCTCIVIK